MTTLIEIIPRENPDVRSPTEFEAIVSEDGVPVFISWQPFETTELAKEAVLRLVSNTNPVTLKTTNLAGEQTVEEIR